MKHMRWFTLALAVSLGCSPLAAADEKSKTAERLEDAAALFSEIMGTPDGTVASRLSRGRQRLRKLLAHAAKERGYDLSSESDLS